MSLYFSILDENLEEKLEIHVSNQNPNNINISTPTFSCTFKNEKVYNYNRNGDVVQDYWLHTYSSGKPLKMMGDFKKVFYLLPSDRTKIEYKIAKLYPHEERISFVRDYTLKLFTLVSFYSNLKILGYEVHSKLKEEDVLNSRNSFTHISRVGNDFYESFFYRTDKLLSKDEIINLIKPSTTYSEGLTIEVVLLDSNREYEKNWLGKGINFMEPKEQTWKEKYKSLREGLLRKEREDYVKDFLATIEESIVKKIGEHRIILSYTHTLPSQKKETIVRAILEYVSLQGIEIEFVEPEDRDADDGHFKIDLVKTFD